MTLLSHNLFHSDCPDPVMGMKMSTCKCGPKPKPVTDEQPRSRKMSVIGDSSNTSTLSGREEVLQRVTASVKEETQVVPLSGRLRADHASEKSEFTTPSQTSTNQTPIRRTSRGQQRISMTLFRADSVNKYGPPDGKRDSRSGRVSQEWPASFNSEVGAAKTCISNLT
jgi:hypothetical protein